MFDANAIVFHILFPNNVYVKMSLIGGEFALKYELNEPLEPTKVSYILIPHGMLQDKNIRD